MKFFLPLVVYSILLCCGTVNAQKRTLAETPACALQCIATGLATAGANATAQLVNILCPNVELQSQLSICVQTSCNFNDQIIASEVQATLCQGYPNESRSTGIIILVAVFSAIAFPIAILKFYTRWATSHSFEYDDCAAAVAMVCLAALASIEITSATLGLGQHYWVVQADKGVVILKLYFVAQMLYIIIQVSAKISLFLLYIRVFPRSRTSLLSKLGMAFLVTHGFTYLLLIVFQCTPIGSIWDRSISGKCLNLTAIGYTGAVASILEDFFILLIPIFDVKKLQLGKSKQWSLIIMFSIGSFACITSIIRLGFLSKFSNSFDSTWDQTDVVQWSIVEEFTAVICACLPSLRSFVRQAFKSFSTTMGTSSNNNSALRRSSHRRLDNANDTEFHAMGDMKYSSAAVGNDAVIIDKQNRI